jgi:hypothetical protein
MAVGPTELLRQLDRVSREVLRAEDLHGDEATSSPTNTDAKRLAILGEEFGEVCRAMTYDNGGEEKLLEELTQVAAVAVAWVLSRTATN